MGVIKPNGLNRIAKISLGHLKWNVLGQCIESHIGEHYQELILVKLMSVHYSNEPDIGLKQLIFLRCAISHGFNVPRRYY